MGALSVVVGTVLLLATAWDLFRTVFQPSLRGPVSRRLNRAIWGLLDTAARRGRAQWRVAAGPVCVIADVLLWVGGLVVAFALLYLPFLDRFAYADSVSSGHHGAAVALYVSGVTAMTIGFGDVVAGTDVLRLATVVEGAAGAAMFSASITYVLSVYPIVTEQRTTALRFSDLHLQEPHAAAALIRARGLDPLETLHVSLIRNRQHLQRFPVLYYFQPAEERASTYALLRGAATVVAILRWTPERHRDGAEQYATALDETLQRTIDDYAEGYVHGPASAQVSGPPGAHGGATDREAWLARVQDFLDRLAEAHGSAPAPLLADVHRSPRAPAPPPPSLSTR